MRCGNTDRETERGEKKKRKGVCSLFSRSPRTEILYYQTPLAPLAIIHQKTKPLTALLQIDVEIHSPLISAPLSCGGDPQRRIFHLGAQHGVWGYGGSVEIEGVEFGRV